MLSDNAVKLAEYIYENPTLSSKELYESAGLNVGYATVKRLLTQLLTHGLVQASGKGRATRYLAGHGFKLLHPLDLDLYFLKEIDERVIQSHFNWSLLREGLSETELFTAAEMAQLVGLQSQYEKNSSQLSEKEYEKELERLAVDLSWKSSQIEGNTYSLLETERLLKEKETAEGKPRDDATMLLNHKDTLDFIFANDGLVTPLTIAAIENIYSLLMKELGVERNIRRRKVGITGTNYVPLDNEFQIREALQLMCELVNLRSNVFEKALLVLVLLSYIQAFDDGNKRTARIVSNAVLIDHDYCPISFRTVSSIDYKKAMLIFYEQNNISAFKKIFIEQFEFAVNTYF